jgi:putative cell wall-binding protein
VPSETAQELIRLKPGRIVVVGGTAVVSNTVISQLAAYTTGPVIRIAGHDRYATADDLSSRYFDSTARAVFLATGEAFPDALSGAAAVGRLNGPLLLTRTSSLPPGTHSELERLFP